MTAVSPDPLLAVFASPAGVAASWRDLHADGLLTLDEEQRLHRMTAAGAQRLRRAAWIFRREAVAAYLGTDAASLMFPRAHREPLACGAHVSLSHATGAVAVAISKAPVGVDIEPVAGPGDPYRLAARCFGADEAATIAAARDPALAFVWRWSAKEALLKATGLSLRAALAKDLGPDAPLPITRDIDGVSLAVVEPAAGFVCAVARRA